MIVCNLGRMFTLASIPIAYLLGAFSFIQIFIVALVNGVLSVFFDAAYQEYLPVLVDKKDLIEGNQKLQVSASGAQFTGPGIAGLVYTALGGALTVAFDAVGYLASSLSLSIIGKQEEKKERSLYDPPPSFFGEMKEGIRVVMDNPILKRIAASTATSNLGTNMLGAVFVIFALDYLHLSPLDLASSAQLEQAVFSWGSS